MSPAVTEKRAYGTESEAGCRGAAVGGSECSHSFHKIRNIYHESAGLSTRLSAVVISRGPDFLAGVHLEASLVVESRTVPTWRRSTKKFLVSEVSNWLVL